MRLEAISRTPSTTTRPVRHPSGVDRHALQPGVEMVGVPHGADLTPRGDEGLLGRVARVGLIGEDRE